MEKKEKMMRRKRRNKEIERTSRRKEKKKILKSLETTSQTHKNYLGDTERERGERKKRGNLK
jgi:hypothetical protein